MLTVQILSGLSPSETCASGRTFYASQCRDASVYLECSGWGCNGRAEGLGDESPPAGSRVRALVRVWGLCPQKLQVQCNIVPIKTAFHASSVCISLLKHALKLKRHTVDLLLLHITDSTGYLGMMYPARGSMDWGQMSGVLSEVRGVYTPQGGLYNVLQRWIKLKTCLAKFRVFRVKLGHVVVVQLAGENTHLFSTRSNSNVSLKAVIVTVS